MKNIIIVLMSIVCIGLIGLYSQGNNPKVTRIILDENRKYLCYEFGFCKIITVRVADGDSICDVIITDGNNNSIFTTCEKSPILQWAFDLSTNSTINHYAGIDSINDHEYKPYYYRLSLINDSCQTISCSSSSLLIYNEDVESKISELKSFMVNLWYTNQHQFNNTNTKCHE